MTAASSPYGLSQEGQRCHLHGVGALFVGQPVHVRAGEPVQEPCRRARAQAQVQDLLRHKHLANVSLGEPGMPKCFSSRSPYQC